MHYSRWHRTGDPGTAEERKLTTGPNQCVIDGCTTSVVGFGFCSKHYIRWKKTGHPLGLERVRSETGVCTIDGCGGVYLAKGMCSRHYARIKRNGDLAVRKGGPRRRDGHVVVHDSGRRAVYTPEHVLSRSSGLVAEHRLVLFDAIGYGPHRCHWCEKWVNWGWPMSCRLDVDHLDWDPSNNDLSNLVASCNPCNSMRHRGHPQYPPGGVPLGSPHPLSLSAVTTVAHRK